MKLKILWVMIAVIGIASQAQAATYYVATTGNDGNPGTQTAPWKTFQKAVDTVSGGDNVYFRAGTYAGGRFLNKHPSQGQWITFKPYNTDKVIIDSGVTPSGTGIRLSGASYIIIDGFEITDKSYPHNLVHSCDLRNDPGGTCLSLAQSLRGGGSSGISFSGTRNNATTDNHHIIVRNNNIHHHTSYGATAGAFDPVRIPGSIGQHDIEIINNQFHNNGIPGLKEGYGTYLRGTRLVVRGNIAHHNTGNNFRFATQDNPGTEELVDSIIENNISYSNEGPWLHAGTSGIVDAGFGIVIWGGIGNIVRNNLVYNTLGTGIGVLTADGSPRPDLVYNNTVYGNGGVGLQLFRSAIARNNIIWGNATRISAHQLRMENTHTGIVENNIVGGGSLRVLNNGSGTEKNNLDIDPLLWDPVNSDFGLKLLSPAIDAGATLPEVKTDFIGNPRPDGPNYDIGAFEASGSHPNPAPGGGDGGIGGGSPPCCV